MSVDEPIDIPTLSEEKRQELMAEYPEWALYLDDPEIVEILLWAQGEAEVVDDTIISDRIRQTSWWQDNADTARAWDYAQLYDPATAAASLDQKMNDFAALAARYGVRLNEQTLRSLADSSIRFGWEDDEDARSIIALVESGAVPTTNTGTIAGNEAYIRQELGKWLMKMDAKTMRDFALKLTTGEIEESAITLWAKEHATAKWSHLSHIWDKGINAEQYFQPVRQKVAEMLELNINDVDLMDSKWGELTQMVDENGNIRSMTDYEAEKWARSQKEFQGTKTYRAESANVAGTIRKMFGNF